MHLWIPTGLVHQITRILPAHAVKRSGKSIDQFFCGKNRMVRLQGVAVKIWKDVVHIATAAAPEQMQVVIFARLGLAEA